MLRITNKKLVRNKYKIEAQFCFIESGHCGKYSKPLETEILIPKIVPLMKIIHNQEKNHIALQKQNK